MACPRCFAEAGPGFSLRLEEVEDIVDRFVAAEGWACSLIVARLRAAERVCF